MSQDTTMETVHRLVDAHRQLPGALLPLLHAVQDALGHVPDSAVPAIAEGLNLSRAEVHGVITYYHHFRRVPAGRHVLQVCRAEACQAMGADALWSHACSRLGTPEGGTSADGAVTLEPVYCLGLCALSPAVALDEQPRARMSAPKLDALLEGARA
ncbi:formate dehydrogenase subunit gamma [Pseudorhodoferax sp.]|uniref:formate dehydrogenase subunit gamma n=1 Tax=Pseudorhodoferax sp. TaxID=1993553 RepID=UPI002DD6995F|nr:formate dehydrogenase subunit gamma [Pseudorhodoferax sp.]